MRESFSPEARNDQVQRLRTQESRTWHRERGSNNPYAKVLRALDWLRGDTPKQITARIDNMGQQHDQESAELIEEYNQLESRLAAATEEVAAAKEKLATFAREKLHLSIDEESDSVKDDE